MAVRPSYIRIDLIMPYYDYKCPKCVHVEEHMHKIMENVDISCPTCGIPLYKSISCPNIRFVGGSPTNNDITGMYMDLDREPPDF